MSVLTSLYKNFLFSHSKGTMKILQTSIIPVRFAVKEKRKFFDLPKPGVGKCFRRIVHFPEEYTVKPLNTTHLGGREPATGRQIVSTLGGGLKHKYHWIKWERVGPSDDSPPLQEKVLRILKCGCRTAYVALVASNDQLKYILATENMKPGDIIKTSKFIPKHPIVPNEGDAYPLGAMAIGTVVHNVQLHPNTNVTIIHAAGSCAIIKRNSGTKVILQLTNQKELYIDPKCMATAGKLSNSQHSSTPIGSPQNLRLLGYRPRSGLWKRKTGRFGRKIKALKIIAPQEKKTNSPGVLRCTLPTINI